MRRVCHKSRNRDDDDDDEDEEEEASPTGEAQHSSPLRFPYPTAPSTSEPASEVTSPRMRPCSPSDAASDELRPPLEALPADPNNAMAQLDMLSRMAAREMAA